jgi:hypothetical protein
MWTSENASSTHFVNKGKKKDRSLEMPRYTVYRLYDAERGVSVADIRKRAED